jgi:hypothetical protein
MLRPEVRMVGFLEERAPHIGRSALQMVRFYPRAAANAPPERVVILRVIFCADTSIAPPLRKSCAAVKPSGAEISATSAVRTTLTRLGVSTLAVL